jgi:hypothetical protein
MGWIIQTTQAPYVLRFKSRNCGHLLINEKDHADVWKYMNEIG